MCIEGPSEKIQVYQCISLFAFFHRLIPGTAAANLIERVKKACPCCLVFFLTPAHEPRLSVQSGRAMRIKVQSRRRICGGEENADLLKGAIVYGYSCICVCVWESHSCLTWCFTVAGLEGACLQGFQRQVFTAKRIIHCCIFFNLKHTQNLFPH